MRAQVWAEVRAELADGGRARLGGEGGAGGLDNLIVSRDPEVRAMCMTLLEDGHSVWSQMNQDTFVFHNYLVSRGNVGVYVDIVRVHDRMSNTAFFDLCLGWKGLCIDMGPIDETRERFAEHRSCICINGLSACMASILRDHNLRHIDLLSVDLEGNELQAMAFFPFQDIIIDVIVMKNSGLMDWAANFLMSVNGLGSQLPDVCQQFPPGSPAPSRLRLCSPGPRLAAHNSIPSRMGPGLGAGGGEEVQ